MISGPDFLLVVCDDAINRDLMLHRLSRRGFNVSSAGNGEDAMEQIQSRHVDLVLLDLEMPGSNGIETLKTLRQTHTPEQLPIIMVIDKADSNGVAEVLAAGANDYVTKPIDLSVVLARIQTQLSRMHAEEALRDSEERYALAARGANDGLVGLGS